LAGVKFCHVSLFVMHDMRSRGRGSSQLSAQLPGQEFWKGATAERTPQTSGRLSIVGFSLSIHPRKYWVNASADVNVEILDILLRESSTDRRYLRFNPILNPTSFACC